MERDSHPPGRLQRAPEGFIDKSGVPYQLTPMGTILEGEFDAVMAVVAACFKALEPDCSRIGMNLKMDYRAGPESRLKSKIAKVEQTSRVEGRTMFLLLAGLPKK